LDRRAASRSPSPKQTYKLYVEKLPPAINEAAVRTVFEQFGKVVEVILLGLNGLYSPGRGFVKYGSANAARAAIITLNKNVTLTGSHDVLEVRLAHGTLSLEELETAAYYEASRHEQQPRQDGDEAQSADAAPSLTDAQRDIEEDWRSKLQAWRIESGKGRLPVSVPPPAEPAPAPPAPKLQQTGLFRAALGASQSQLKPRPQPSGREVAADDEEVERWPRGEYDDLGRPLHRRRPEDRARGRRGDRDEWRRGDRDDRWYGGADQDERWPKGSALGSCDDRDRARGAADQDEDPEGVADDRDLLPASFASSSVKRRRVSLEPSTAAPAAETESREESAAASVYAGPLPRRTNELVKTGDAARWQCQKVGCGTMCELHLRSCSVCATPRPSQQRLAARGLPTAPPPTPLGPGEKPPPPPRHIDPRRGDWACLCCGNWNYSKRDECNRCSTPQPAPQLPQRAPRCSW